MNINLQLIIRYTIMAFATAKMLVAGKYFFHCPPVPQIIVLGFDFYVLT